MKKTIIQTVTGIMVLCLLVACSKDGDKKEDEVDSSKQHRYHISIAGGKTYQGGIPISTAGIALPVSSVEYNEDLEKKIVSTILMEAEVFQIGVGFLLDENNEPSLRNNAGIVFGEWEILDKYTPTGPINLTLKDYKEHPFSLDDEEETIASFTLRFSGNFKRGNEGKEVSATGEIVVAAL